MHSLFPVLLILLLLLVSAFFSAGELGIMTLSRLRVESQARAGSRIARMQLSLRDRPQRFLSTILLGYNIANISLATYSGYLAEHYLTSIGWSPKAALSLSTGLTTVVVVIFAELVPKTYAAMNPERLGVFATVPLYYLDRLLTPVNWLFERVVNPLLWLLTAGRTSHVEHVPERAEVLTAVAMARAGGRLHAVDARVAHEALHFSSICLSDVMTPRVDVTGVAEGATLGEAMRLMHETGYSRLPVYRETLDEIIGLVLIKDMVGLLASDNSAGITAREEPEEQEAGQNARATIGWLNDPVAAHMREVSYFPETKPAVDALTELRKMRNHMAVVVDEHGGTAGVVTLEDILEELIGDIRDESDPDHSTDIVSRGEGFLIVTGRARLDNLPELGEVPDLDSESSSIGGLIMERIGRRAVVGDEITVGGLKITALKVLRNQIKLVRIDYSPVKDAENT